MSEADQNTHRFSVHARHVDRHHSRVVEEESFEAAAIAYIENFSPVLSSEDQTDESAVSVIVRDLGSGHEHCFTVDLDSGETTACG